MRRLLQRAGREGGALITVRKLEKISGHPVSVSRQGDQFAAAVACQCGDDLKIIWEAGRDEGKVLADLLQAIYKHHSLIVFNRSGWKCSECGRSSSLEIDHIIPRARGRSDAVSNLRPLCSGFTGCQTHRRKHGG